MTKVQTKIDAHKDKALRDVKLRLTKQYLQTAKDNMELHEALQCRVFELMREREESTKADLQTEKARHDTVYDTYRETTTQAEDLVKLVTYHQEGVILQAEVDGIAKMSKLTVSAVRDNLRQQKSEVTKCQVRTVDYADDERLAPLRQTLQDSVNTQNLQLAAELKLSEATRDKADDPKAAPTAIVSHSELKIDLPPFSGKPTDLHDFAATMKKRGSHLSKPEKCCLLLKAMSTEEAKSMVNKYKTGDEGYEAAVKALEEAYGHPKYIYPIHVKTLMKADHYTYSHSSQRRMREMIKSILRSMSSVKGDTFKHLVAVILMERYYDNMNY